MEIGRSGQTVYNLRNLYELLYVGEDYSKSLHIYIASGTHGTSNASVSADDTRRTRVRQSLSERFKGYSYMLLPHDNVSQIEPGIFSVSSGYCRYARSMPYFQALTQHLACPAKAGRTSSRREAVARQHTRLALSRP